MTARTPSRQVPPAGKPADRASGPANWSALPIRLRWALGVGLVGGASLAVGPLLPVVSPAMPPGFAAGPLMFVLGLLPVGVALVLAGRGSVPAARGALLAAALFAPGRAIADAQLAVQGSVAARPELVMPTALLRLHGAAGLWLLLAGEVLVLVGGLLAIGTGDTDPTARESGRTSGRYQGPVLIALGLGVVVALGLMAAPFTSTNPFVLAKGVLDAPIMAMAGGFLIAVAAPLAATIAVTSADPVTARGWLLGGQAVVLAIALPRVVSGFAVAGLHPNWGPFVALVAAALLVALALTTERVIRPAPDDDTDVQREPAELQLPGQSRLHVATGVLGLVAAGAALVGADTNLYVLSADLPRNTDVAGRLLIPAAVLIGVCAVGMLIPRWAFVVRPAFAVAWVSVLLAGFGAVDTAMTATQIDGVRIGIGTWATGLAMVTALAAACTAGLAGGVERDDVDLTELSWRPRVLVPAVVAAALAVGAFGLPVLQAAGFRPPGIWSDFRFASWGLVFSLAAVLAAALLAPICRPARAVGLLIGAAGLVLVRLLSLPLDRSMAPGTSAGPGLPIAVACLVALLVAAGMAGWLARGEPVNRAEPVKRTAVDMRRKA
ncbi:MAG TPA: hypothetical protein VGL06_09770 [Pseudonocardiaceae bacterium]